MGVEPDPASTLGRVLGALRSGARTSYEVAALEDICHRVAAAQISNLVARGLAVRTGTQGFWIAGAVRPLGVYHATAAEPRKEAA